MSQLVSNAALRAVLLLPAVAIFIVAGALATQNGSPAQAATQATLVLSHNGKILAVKNLTCGQSSPGPACTEIELDWTAGRCFSGQPTENPPVVVSFTIQGKYDGRPAVSPCGTHTTAGARHSATPPAANDVEYVPNSSPGPGNQTITSAYWTQNGTLTSRVLPPEVGTVHRGQSANSTGQPDGIHVYLSYGAHEQLTAIKLRHGTKVVAKVVIPPGTNQVDWYGYTPQSLP